MKILYTWLTMLSLALCAGPLSAQQPLLNSYPSAPATIFLDFDGHLVTGTSWNYSGSINCGPSGLNNEGIIEVFHRVAEDYRPFNINVTTDSAKFHAAPVNRRMRIIVTVTSEWYGAAGGVAYIGSFTWGDDTPAFVFSALLGYNRKSVAEAASHEMGHTLGLRHQSSYDNNCVKTSEYNPGAGSGEISWAPIMGVSYHRNQTLWHQGSNPWGCNIIQDDLGIVTGATNGFGYRTDDHAGTVSGATEVSWNSNTFEAAGVIERSTDADLFRFTLPVAGQLSLQAVPTGLGAGNSGSNLDMQLEILNDQSQVLATYNPEQQLCMSLDSSFTAGTYFLRIRGKGNAFAPEYASLGSFSLSARYTPSSAALPLRRLELSGSKTALHHSLSWIIDADETVVSQELQVSTDNVNFNTPVSLSATARQVVRMPGTEATTYYRLKVVFDNGRQYYSNVISLRNSGNGPGAALVQNPVGSAASIRAVMPMAFQIFDFSGRAVKKGLLQPGVNMIDLSGMPAGVYLVRYEKEGHSFSEKMLKN